MKKILFVLLVVTVLAGCTPADPSQAPAPSTPPAEPTLIDPPVTIPPSTEPEKPSASETFIPIVSGSSTDILLGSYYQNAWLDAKETSALIKGTETYTLNSLDASVGTVTGTAVTYAEPCDSESIELPTDKSYALALGSIHNAHPRPVTILSPQSETYVNVATDYLAANGLPDVPVEIKEIYRLDLDGDGTNEVLMNISNIDFEKVDIRQRAGTYSILLLRQIVNGKVVTTPLFSAIYTKDATDEGWQIAEAIDITAFADINGDNVMEVVIESRYYEGFTFIIYELENGTLKERLNNGWGV